MTGQAQHPNAEALPGMQRPLQVPPAMTSPLGAPDGEAAELEHLLHGLTRAVAKTCQW